MKKIDNSEIDQIKNIDNPRFELNRLVGYKFNQNAEVYAEDNLGAYIIIEKNYLNSNENYVRFLMGCKRGSGSILLKDNGAPTTLARQVAGRIWGGGKGPFTGAQSQPKPTFGESTQFSGFPVGSDGKESACSAGDPPVGDAAFPSASGCVCL